MPQPATHYLVTRRAIPQEYWGIWWDKYKPYFGLGSSAPDLFYFPLMPNIKNISKEIAWSELADPMHSSKSYDMFCTLLDVAKNNKTANLLSSEKQFAFAFGYYCHVITDCIFHPYVYRSTNDHWSTKNYMNEAKHKMQEYIIDTGVFNKYYDKQKFSRLQWECNEGSQPLLDYSIAEQFNDALQTNYSDCYPLTSDITSEYHPIQQAYSALVQSIPTLFTGKTIYLFGANRIIDARKFNNDAQLRFFISPYPNCDSLDRHTPEELFDFSASTCRKVFGASIQFWNSSSTDSKNYFIQHQTHYLNAGNWNLDTGLPSHYNNYVAMREENDDHFLFKADELKMTYDIIKAEYNASDYI